MSASIAKQQTGTDRACVAPSTCGRNAGASLLKIHMRSRHATFAACSKDELAWEAMAPLMQDGDKAFASRARSFGGSGLV